MPTIRISEQIFLNEDIMSCVSEYIPNGCILPYLLVNKTTLNSWRRGNNGNNMRYQSNTTNEKTVSDVSYYCESVAMLEWAIQANMPITAKVFAKTCERGNLECVKRLRLHYNCPWDALACRYAARGGKLDVLQWLYTQDVSSGWPSIDVLVSAAICGHLHVLQWIHSQGHLITWDNAACLSAASGNGHLHILQWLRNQDPPCQWDSKACSNAAWFGHLHILKWLRNQDPPCPWDGKACSNPAAYGNLDVLRWLRSQNPPCPWDCKACSNAAAYGKLDVLRWLRSQDPPCPWNVSNCLRLAEKGSHWEIVTWIRNGNGDV
jgi:hypothetical protein